MQFGPGFNSRGPWATLETKGKSLRKKKATRLTVTAFACYPPAKWGKADFVPKIPTAYAGLEPVLPQAYKDADEARAAGATAFKPPVRMHRFRPVYMALQLSWTDKTTMEPHHRCVLSENSQRRDADRNTVGPADPNLVHAALPVHLGGAKFTAWVKAHYAPGSALQDVPALGFYKKHPKGSFVHGLHGECFHAKPGVRGEHCNTFKSIHDPDARCQPDGAGASQKYRPKSDHDDMFKNKPAEYATWAEYCDAQFTAKKRNRPDPGGAGAHDGTDDGADGDTDDGAGAGPDPPKKPRWQHQSYPDTAAAPAGRPRVTVRNNRQHTIARGGNAGRAAVGSDSDVTMDADGVEESKGDN